MKSIESILEVNGDNYIWHVSRQPQWCHEDGWQGVQITVEPQTNPKRLLLVQLPFEVSSRRSTPHKQRPKINKIELSNHIVAAIKTGWEPVSKGKPYKYVA